jgi:hypothetical protein
MILSALRRSRLIPDCIVLFLVTLIFSLRTIYPYVISSDAAYSLKAVQQWVRGISPILNTLTLVDPNNLAQDAQAWIAWWSPGMAFVFTPLAAIGLPLGQAALLTVYLLFITGSLGWLRVAEKVNAEFPVKIAIAVTLPLLAIGDATRYVAYGLMVGEIVAYAVTSWLFLTCLDLSARLLENRLTFWAALFRFGLLSFCWGSIYWLKYSTIAIGSISVLR